MRQRSAGRPAQAVAPVHEKCQSARWKLAPHLSCGFGQILLHRVDANIATRLQSRTETERAARIVRARLGLHAHVSGAVFALANQNHAQANVLAGCTDKSRKCFATRPTAFFERSHFFGELAVASLGDFSAVDSCESRRSFCLCVSHWGRKFAKVCAG